MLIQFGNCILCSKSIYSTFPNFLIVPKNANLHSYHPSFPKLLHFFFPKYWHSIGVKASCQIFGPFRPVLWSTYRISLLINFGLNSFMEISDPPYRVEQPHSICWQKLPNWNQFRLATFQAPKLSNRGKCFEEEGCLQAALNQSLNYFPALFSAIYLPARSEENKE